MFVTLPTLNTEVIHAATSLIIMEYS